MTRYILHPGHIRHANTGQWFRIGAPMLRHLYLVPAGAYCVDASLPMQPDGHLLEARPGDVHLCVMQDGAYPAMRRPAPSGGPLRPAPSGGPLRPVASGGPLRPVASGLGRAVTIDDYPDWMR